MFIAGLATLIQLYPVWKIESRLPIVMGVSFTFVTVLCTVAANYGYPSVIGTVICGGIFEGTIGLFAKYWRKIIFMVSGVEMLDKAGFTQRNVTIAALSLSIGIGFTAASEIDLWHIFPAVVQSVFAENVVAVVFVVSIVLNLVLPKNMDLKKIDD